MKKTLTIVALLAIIATSMVVVFRNLAPANDDGYVTPRQRAIIKKFDQDGDGTLNKEEKRAADAAIAESERREREEWIKRLDKDGDGKVSREERETAERAAEQRKQEWIRKHDQDGDGKIDGAERQAAGRAARAGPGDIIK